MRRIFVILICLAELESLQSEESRVVVITGASRNVGLATAEYLAEKGFSVYGTIRPSKTPPATEKTNLHFLPVDLMDENAIHQAMQTILTTEGHIDVLINNAAYAIAGPIESLSKDEIQEQMEVNFFAPIRFIQAVLPSMRECKAGHIINISSTNAVNTCPFGSIYAASKSALESFSESLCIEVLPHNIKVSIVEPGLLSTNFSIRMGTREITNNPYQNIIEAMKTAFAERSAHPELLSPSQTSQEIALFLLEVLQDPNPKLRYQTSEEAKRDVSRKLLDLTGELYLNQILEQGQ